VDVSRPADPHLDRRDRDNRTPRRHWLLRRPTFGGTAVALLFWWWSLDRAGCPRSWYARGAVRGLSAAIRYLLGTRAGYGVGALLRRLGRTPAPRARRRWWVALGAVAAAVVSARTSASIARPTVTVVG
jgi:uncharacterized membrane protein